MRGGDGIAPWPTSRRLKEDTGYTVDEAGRDRPTPSPPHTDVEAIRWPDRPYPWH